MLIGKKKPYKTNVGDGIHIAACDGLAMVGFVCFVFLVSLCTSSVCGSNGKLDEFTNRNGVIIVVNEDRLYFNQNLIDNNYKSGQFYCARVSFFYISSILLY